MRRELNSRISEIGPNNDTRTMTPEPSKEQCSPYEPPREESDPVETDWRDRITPKHFAMATYGCVLLFLLGPIGIAIAIAVLTRLFTLQAS